MHVATLSALVAVCVLTALTIMACDTSPPTAESPVATIEATPLPTAPMLTVPTSTPTVTVTHSPTSTPRPPRTPSPTATPTPGPWGNKYVTLTTAPYMCDGALFVNGRINEPYRRVSGSNDSFAIYFWPASGPSDGQKSYYGIAKVGRWLLYDFSQYVIGHPDNLGPIASIPAGRVLVQSDGAFALNGVQFPAAVNADPTEYRFVVGIVEAGEMQQIRTMKLSPNC